jgi:hypothetical protein
VTALLHALDHRSGDGTTVVGRLLDRGERIGSSTPETHPSPPKMCFASGSNSKSAVEAGYMPGSVLVAMLHTSPEFRRDMDAARSELAPLKAPAPEAERCMTEASAG